MTLEDFNKYILIVCISVFAGIIIGSIWCKNSSPVENNNNTIDSLTKVNDSIKLKVEHLDSIKNAKVIEVSTLDNDSTLKLFYKLVSE